MYLVALKRACCVGCMASACLSLGLLGLLGEKDGLDVGQDTSLGDGDTRQKLVQLLVVTDGELKMSWDNSGLLVVSGSITGKFEHFGSKVLHNSSEVNRR